MNEPPIDFRTIMEAEGASYSKMRSFTSDQLTSLLLGAINLYQEYCESESVEGSAAAKAVAEVFDGLEAEDFLVQQGVLLFRTIQT